MERVSRCSELLLNILWHAEEEELSTREVINRYESLFGKAYARTTVVTFAQRLIEKGYVSSKRRGKQAFLKAEIKEEDYVKEKLKEELALWFENDKEKMIEAIKRV